jgi:cullin 3
MPLIYEMGIDCFRDALLSPSVSKHVVDSIVALVNLERDGHFVNRRLMILSIRMLLDIPAGGGHPRTFSLYDSHLEKAFIDACQIYYQNKSRKLLDCPETTCFDYLLYVQGRLQQEEDRMDECFYSHTKKQVISVLETQMLELQLGSLIEVESFF